MIAGVYILQEMFAKGILAALKPFLEHDRKHVLQLLRLMKTRLLSTKNSFFVQQVRHIC